MIVAQVPFSDSQLTPVDLTKIEELRALDPDDPDGILREIVDLFLESAPQNLQKARQALEEDLPKVFAREAHSLRGSGAQFGAYHLGELCLALEKVGLTGPRAETTGLLDDAEREFHRVRTALQEYL